MSAMDRVIIIAVVAAIALSGFGTVSGFRSAAAQTAPAQNSAAEPAIHALESRPLAEDIALTKATIALLQAKNFSALRERLDLAIGQLTEDRLRQMSDAFGTGEPASIETISASESHNLRTGEGTSRILLEYGFGSKWVVVDAGIKTKGAEKRFLRLNFFPNSMPLRELNAFHLLGKGTRQYLFLAGWIFAIVMTAYAAYLALRRNAGWRRWVLVLLMPLGLTPTVVMNWNTAQIFIFEALGGAVIPIFAARYPMAFFGKNEALAPYFYISAPLIATAYLIWKGGKGRPASLPAEADQTVLQDGGTRSLFKYLEPNQGGTGADKSAE
jgi:hypothetical protein